METAKCSSLIFPSPILVKSSQKSIESAAALYSIQQGVNRIIKIENILYNNSGDWVENCTALAENHSGRLGVGT